METTNKNDFIDIYVLKTLNEIKDKVKQNIKLKPELEKATDEKMKIILKDLINANFKNLQRDPKGNLIYTLLPIVDEIENNKIRITLVLYYTALYYDNVDLLKQMLAEEVTFTNGCIITLQYLDKTVSSKFPKEDYIKYIKRFGSMFEHFTRSITNLSEEEKEKYAQRFASLFKLKYEELCTIQNEHKGYFTYELANLFVKDNLDKFENNTYSQADKKQLELIDFCAGNKYNEETKTRLNNLIQNTNYSNKLHNFDLMMSIYSDEELSEIKYETSYFLSLYSDTPQTLQKAIDLIKLSPEKAQCLINVSKELFMKINNQVLIEAIDYMDKHYLEYSKHNIELYIKTNTPKIAFKNILGIYKKGF